MRYHSHIIKFTLKMVFSVFIDLCNDRHYVLENILGISKETLYPWVVSRHSLLLPALLATGLLLVPMMACSDNFMWMASLISMSCCKGEPMYFSVSSFIYKSHQSLKNCHHEGICLFPNTGFSAQVEMRDLGCLAWNFFCQKLVSFVSLASWNKSKRPLSLTRMLKYRKNGPWT